MNNPLKSCFTSGLVIRAMMPVELEKGDAQLYMLTSDLRYYSQLFGAELVVPSGYVTDFASIPGPLLWFMDDDAPGILYPSVVHDYLYTLGGVLPNGKTYSRKQADLVLREAMESCGAGAFKRSTVYRAVRIGGATHWLPKKAA